MVNTLVNGVNSIISTVPYTI